MKKIKRNMLKVVVLVALFAPSVFADGEMGGGGLAGTGNGTRDGKVVVSQTSEDGEMGGGSSSDKGYLDSIMSAIYDYFERMT